MEDCKLYGSKGELIRAVESLGDLLEVASGVNEIEFSCESEVGVNPRAYVTVIMEGEPISGVNPPDQIRATFLRKLEEAVEQVDEK